MSSPEGNFKLPRNIDRYLAALSKVYEQEGQEQLQEIIVNSRVRVHEEMSSDNWNGGIYGHALYLLLPETLYLKSVRQKKELENQIKEGINKVHNFQSEFIEAVFIEMEVLDDHDWRRESGLLLIGKHVISSEAEKRIWGDEGFRVFLSHKSDVKEQTAKLKEQLKLFGVACFLAHEDIHPTKAWQDEIENALSSMDALVALMTENFHDSCWTDQEVGFAFGCGVPIISVKLGRDPYGFIGKFQALSCSSGSAAKEIVKLLVRHDQMLDAYIKAVEKCNSYDEANKLSEILPSISRLSDRQIRDLIYAFKENDQVYWSHGFDGKKPKINGNGLGYHLNRLTGKEYELARSGKIKDDL
jgi:TIR domain